MSQKLFQTLKDSVEREGSLETCFHKTYFNKVRKTENRLGGGGNNRMEQLVKSGIKKMNKATEWGETDGEVGKESLCSRSDRNIYEEKIFDLEIKA